MITAGMINYKTQGASNMEAKLNLQELIELATKIELEGKEFYSQAAAFTSNESARELFTELAKWEDNHYNTFKNLLEGMEIDEFEQVIDPMNEAALYLDALLGGDIFTKGSTPQKLADNNPDNLDAIFRFAIDREKDSIIFYSSLEKILNTEETTNKIDIIIGEEISHVRFLHEIKKKGSLN